ncbi:MAG: hypothetical protein GPJ00_19995 [Microcystis aeruginosa W13-18]|nr:hypothetical protein [Microcystis aeruginosa W13-18]NCR51058.1 hypothetical protein [Microcystis aeruginosa S11-01]
MRNVNLNILKFLESINNFCLSLANIGLEVSLDEKIFTSRDERGFLPYTPHPTPHTLHPTPYTPHPTPYTPHPTPYTPHPTVEGDYFLENKT